VVITLKKDDYLLSYINLSQKDYYETGVLRKNYNYTYLEADRETVATITSGVVKIFCHGVKALVAAGFPANKYRLPR
jgi:hypothetical protein